MLSTFPREIAAGVLWFGNCLSANVGRDVLHAHLSSYLIKGTSKTLLVDTGMPQTWSSLKVQLSEALDGRELDLVFPTHPEAPHCANLPRILRAYPSCRVVGDVRDYACYFPEFDDRLDHSAPSDVLDLGGKRVEFLPAILKDLPSSLWAFETTERVLFTSDGFCFLHAGSPDPFSDHPLHRPGECALTSAELSEGVNLDNAEFFVKSALYWSRYVDPDLLFGQVNDMLSKYPAEVIAPSHGNVIVDVPQIMPTLKQTHVNAYHNTIAAETGATSLPWGRTGEPGEWDER